MSTPYEVLLDVQHHDTAVDQLRYRRAALPARQELVDVERSLGDLVREIEGVAATREGLQREQKRHEDEAASVEDKAHQVDRKLYSGTVTVPKELQALQDDLESLRRRQRELEDRALEVMEAIEPVDGQLQQLGERRVALEEDAERLRMTITAAEAEIDAELDVVAAERAVIAAGVEAGVLADYERLRSRLGGVAVARLEGGRCQGCHLALAAVELDRIKHLPPDEPVHCEECGRLLVR